MQSVTHFHPKKTSRTFYIFNLGDINLLRKLELAVTMGRNHIDTVRSLDMKRMVSVLKELQKGKRYVTLSYSRGKK